MKSYAFDVCQDVISSGTIVKFPDSETGFSIALHCIAD